jgi:hypothetical protein
MQIGTRPRLVVVARGPQQVLERPLVHVTAERLLQLRLGRVEQVDPLGHPAEATAAVG